MSDRTCDCGRAVRPMYLIERSVRRAAAKRPRAAQEPKLFAALMEAIGNCPRCAKQQTQGGHHHGSVEQR